jgi:hypothetical protein
LAILGHKVWTADELVTMTPAQRQAIFDEIISTDINDIPPDMLASARKKIEAHVAQRSPRKPSRHTPGRDATD